ncbi:HlyD family secretion protein [Pontibacter silvestris]|uniref:HlyD family secretion protein n=1 Tax=Pontibacter silvestris TaxID=2305183 RepID=A0ABW4X570_9BACT|nr:HlyD family secretion protein [Pontibacter silvestris]MCC9138332.1 HlyD family secretion protein [Pontibacter silvestris]
MSSPKKNYTETDKLITRITAWAASVILVVLAGWGGYTLYQLWSYEETNDAQVEEYINPVTSRVTGYISKIYYTDNQSVKAGDTLIVLDNNEYQIQQYEAEAALANAQAQLVVLQSSIATSSTNALVSQAQIGAAKAKLWKQEQEYDRYQKLLKAESVTQQQFENVKTALDVARAEYQANLNAYQASLGKTNDIEAQLAVAQAEVKRREAILERAKLDVDYTVIRAPYDGKMGRKTIQKGQLIQAGQTLAFIVDQEQGKWVIANFKETQIKDMHEGQAVIVETDAFPGEEFHGTIESLSPATGSRFSLLPPDNATGNFVKIVQRIPVRIKLTDNVDKVDQLRAGMNANVSLRKGQNS